MNHPPRHRRLAGRTLLAAAGASLVVSAPAVAATQPVPRITAPRNLDTIVAWYDVTQTAVDKAGWTAAGNQQVTASRTWAAAWTAANDAVTEFNSIRDTRRKADAGARRVAVGEAVRDVLVKLTPLAKPYATTQLFYTVQGATASGSSPKAIKLARQLGRKYADQWVADRAFDGLDIETINVPSYTAPAAPALGQWRPTAPGFAAGVQAQQSKGRPFIDPNIAQEVAPEPPAYNSPEVIADLNEIDTLGGTSNA